MGLIKMDAVKFFKERIRMCNSFEGCASCPLEPDCTDTDPELMVKAVEEWSQAHPKKTIMQDFFEKFPNAPKREDGTPCACPAHLGYVKGNDGSDCECELFDYICIECWCRPLED